jgi:hypothetical protein
MISCHALAPPREDSASSTPSHPSSWYNIVWCAKFYPRFIDAFTTFYCPSHPYKSPSLLLVPSSSFCFQDLAPSHSYTLAYPWWPTISISDKPDSKNALVQMATPLIAFSNNVPEVTFISSLKLLFFFLPCKVNKFARFDEIWQIRLSPKFEIWMISTEFGRFC